MSKLICGCLYYCYAPLVLRKQLQKLQNRALRICFLADRYSPNLSLHKEARVLPLDLRAKMELYKLMYRESRIAQTINDNSVAAYVTRAQASFPLNVETPRTDRCGYDQFC